MEDELTQIENQLISSRDLSRDYALKLLSDAVYRNDSNAKTLERQCAKISHAIDKALYELNNLQKITDGLNEEEF